MKTICVDWDGTIYSYTTGWQGPAILPDPPVPGAMEFLKQAVKKYVVAIYSNRSNQPGGENAMRSYLIKHLILNFGIAEGMEIYNKIKFPKEKPHAVVYLDDRGMCFKGVFPSMEELDKFKTWMQK